MALPYERVPLLTQKGRLSDPCWAADDIFIYNKENIRLSAPALDRRRAREVQAVLRRCENDLQRELLRMRYLRALTVPEIVEALSARNLCYTQRHVERLLRRAERSASAAYRELRTGREDAHAPRQ